MTIKLIPLLLHIKKQINSIFHYNNDIIDIQNFLTVGGI